MSKATLIIKFCKRIQNQTEKVTNWHAKTKSLGEISCEEKQWNYLLISISIIAVHKICRRENEECTIFVFGENMSKSVPYKSMNSDKYKQLNIINTR